MNKTGIKRIAYGAAALLLLISAALSFGCSESKNEIQRYENSINYVYSNGEGTTRFFTNEKLLEDRIGGRVDSFLSCDGSVGIARAGTGLYRIDGEGILKIFPAGVDRALLSLDNNIIVFTTSTEVHIYDHRTGKLEDIRPESVVGIASIALSPSGSTVGYSIKNKDGEYSAYAYEDGQSRLLSDDAYIVGVSDGADFWYFIRPGERALYYASAESEKKLGSGVSSYMEFNRELTEVLFDEKGVSMFSRKGEEAKALIEGTSVFCTLAECESQQGGESCQASVKGCSTMLGGVFYGFRDSSSSDTARTVYDLWYVDGSGRSTALVKGTYQFNLTEDRGSLICLVDDSVYSMDSKDPSKREKLCSGVYTYSSTRDGSVCYCIGYDSGLYRVEREGDPVLIAKNAAYSVVTRGGVCLFLTDYDTSGRLHVIGSSGEMKDIGENVAYVEAMPGGVFYYSALYKDENGNNVYDVYSSKDGESFVMAVEKALMETDHD